MRRPAALLLCCALVSLVLLTRHRTASLTPRHCELAAAHGGDRPGVRRRWGLEVHVIGCNRPVALATLLGQLNAPDYSLTPEVDVSLWVHVDHCDGKEDVVRVAKDFAWVGGRTAVEVQETQRGLREMWFGIFEGVQQRGVKETMVLVLEDDMVVAPLFLVWLNNVVQRYFPTPGGRDQAVVGVSLSPVRVMEMKKPFVRWHGVKHTKDSVYLTNLPSSWGPAYWSDSVSDFVPYARERMRYHNWTGEAKFDRNWGVDLKLQPKELEVPGAYSNVWPTSWKKHLIEYMYGRGQVMLYPNFNHEEGYATTLALAGEHSTGQLNNRVSNLTTTLKALPEPVPCDCRRGELRPGLACSPFNGLDVYDIYMEATTRKALEEQGRLFLATVPEKYALLKAYWEGRIFAKAEGGG